MSMVITLLIGFNCIEYHQAARCGDINAVNLHKYTALAYAVNRKLPTPEIVTKLLDLGASVDESIRRKIHANRSLSTAYDAWKVYIFYCCQL